MATETAVLLSTILVALLGYNVYVWAFHDTGTISSVMHTALHHSPWIPFVVGLVLGHWLR